MSHVLIVDNDPAFVRMVEVALTRRGLKTLAAHDGLQALEIVRDELPDCVVLDLILPKISGERVIDHLWEDPVLSRIPVILVSGALLEGGPFPPQGNIKALIPKGPPEATIEEIAKAIERLTGERSSANPEPPEGATCKARLSSRQLVVELIDTNRHFQQMLRTIAEGIIEVDSSARIVFCNPAAEQLLELDSPFLLGLDLFSIIPVEETPLLRQLFRRFAAEEVGSSSALSWSRAGKTLRVTVTPLFEHGAYAGSVLALRDVTANRKRDLLQSSLLMYLNHELKNALGLMEAQVGLLIQGREGEFDLSREEILAYVQRECARLLRLVRDASRIHHAQQGLFHTTFEAIDPAEVVQESLRAVQPRINRKGIDLAVRVPPSLPPVMGSRDRLIQVCLNLLSNATKATREGGRIIISAREDGDSIKVSIEDTGPGFRPEVLERVLAVDPENFKQLDLGGGLRHTGNGLLIARGIVEAHQGKLFIESQPGGGSTVGFVLPSSRSADSPSGVMHGGGCDH